MKYLRVKGFIFLLVVSCAKNEKSKLSKQNFFDSGTISISGQIKGLKSDDRRTIFLEQFNILSGHDEVHSIKMDSSGKFEKALSVFNPQEFTLDYQNEKIRLLVQKSDSIYLSIDPQNQDKKLTISGKGGIRNTLYNQYLHLSSELQSTYYQKVENKELNFIISEHRKATEKLDSLTALIFKDSRPDDLLNNWIIADKKSLGNYDFINFASMNESLPATFLSSKNLITEKELNNQDYYCNRSYVLDIFNYYKIGCVRSENKKLYQGIVSHLKNDNYEDAIKLYADSIFKDFKNLGKDIVLYQSFQQILDPRFIQSLEKTPNMELLKKHYVRNLGNEYIKTLVLNTTHEQEDIVNQNESANVSEEDIIGSLMQKHKDKVLYIDISATWCNPCIRQLPYSVDLHESLNSKEVVFVYLFAKSNRTNWEKIKSKYNLKGENLLITDEQYNFLLAKYNINSGFPNYLIIDKNKRIIKNAKRPSSNKIKDDILELI